MNHTKTLLFSIFLLISLTSCQALSGTLPDANNSDLLSGSGEGAEPDAISTSEMESPELRNAEEFEALDPNRPLRFVVVQHESCANDLTWCDIEAGINAAAADFGVDVEILSPAEFDLEETVALIDSAAASNPDGLAVTIASADLFRGSIMSAMAEGIPVVAYNAGQGPSIDGIPYLTLYAQDDFLAGYAAANRMLSDAGSGDHKAVCINHLVGILRGDSRCSGFSNAMTEAGIEVDVLGIGDNPDESNTIITEYYQANPDADLFLTVGFRSAIPFYSFVEDQELSPDNFTHGSFEFTSDIEEAIYAGVTDFGINEQPYLQGYGAIYSLNMAARYGILPAEPITPTGPGFIDSESMIAEFDAEAPLDIIAIQHARCDWDSFWCVVERGAEVAAENLNVNLTILGPDEFDLEATASLIQQAVDEAPDGIMVTVTDAELFREPLQAAIDAGIPVIAYNAGTGPTQDGIDYQTLFAQDEYLAGYLAAKRLASAAVERGGGTLAVCINHGVGVYFGETRCGGFVDALTEEGIPAEVLGINDDPGNSFAKIGDFYTRNPETDIFLTLGPTGAHPFYSFLVSKGDNMGQFVHGTFDLSPEITENIQTGITEFGIDQQPFLQGYGAVQALELMLRHGVIPPNEISATGPGFVTAETVGTVGALAGEYR